MSQMLADICASSSEYTQNTQRRFHNMEFASLPKTGAVTQGVIKGHVKIHRTTVYVMSVKLQPFTVMISVTDNNYHRQRTHS